MSVQALSWAFRQQLPDAEGCKGSTAKWVLVVLANYANSNDEAYPDPDTTITADTQLSPRAVSRALARLQELGEISDSGRREGQTGRIVVWKLHRRNGATVAALSAERTVVAGQDDGAERSERNGATVAALSEGQSGHGVRGNPATVSRNGAMVSDPLTLPPKEEPSGTVLDEPKDMSAAERRLLFDAFWEAYPRKAGKRKALAAFESALRRASAPRIITAAERYRDDPNRIEAFTAHASTWLNRDSWEDDPLPPRDAGLVSTPRRGGRSRAGDIDWSDVEGLEA